MWERHVWMRPSTALTDAPRLAPTSLPAALPRWPTAAPAALAALAAMLDATAAGPPPPGGRGKVLLLPVRPLPPNIRIEGGR
mmetsp:Transcript_64495/g.127517  ORF Transcript_64495/g.127517 Transcript_64495/m.127517 type:complete len:82 (-) Transcript_64495:58-303(-)